MKRYLEAKFKNELINNKEYYLIIEIQREDGKEVDTFICDNEEEMLTECKAKNKNNLNDDYYFVYTYAIYKNNELYY